MSPLIVLSIYSIANANSKSLNKSKFKFGLNLEMKRGSGVENNGELSENRKILSHNDRQ